MNAGDAFPLINVLPCSCVKFGEILSLLTSTLGLADDSLRPDSSNYIFINESNLDSSNCKLSTAHVGSG